MSALTAPSPCNRCHAICSASAPPHTSRPPPVTRYSPLEGVYLVAPGRAPPRSLVPSKIPIAGPHGGSVGRVGDPSRSGPPALKTSLSLISPTMIHPTPSPAQPRPRWHAVELVSSYDSNATSVPFVHGPITASNPNVSEIPLSGVCIDEHHAADGKADRD